MNKAYATKMTARAANATEEAISNLVAALQEGMPEGQEMCDDEAYASLMNAYRILQTRLGNDVR